MQRAAILWPLATSTQADMLINTETVDGKMRIKLVGHKALYLTAEGTQDGAKVWWKPKAADELQYWRMVEVGGGPAAGMGGKQLTLEKICQQSFTGYNQYFRNHACLATCVLAVAVFYGNAISMPPLVNGELVREDSAYVNSTGKYFSWSWLHQGASKATYCKAIVESINAGKPVVVKMSSENGGDHFVVAYGYTGADTGGILIMDPTDGATRSLASAYAKHGKKYHHIRPCVKG